MCLNSELFGLEGVSLGTTNMSVFLNASALQFAHLKSFIESLGDIIKCFVKPLVLPDPLHPDQENDLKKTVNPPCGLFEKPLV